MLTLVLYVEVIDNPCQFVAVHQVILMIKLQHFAKIVFSNVLLAQLFQHV